MKIAYLHGLESPGFSPKNTFLKKNFNKVYDPTIDYREPDVWSKIYNDLIKFRPDYIIGSSMGGWFAYNLGKKMGIPTLLFNPALQGRSIEPEIDGSGSKYPMNTLVLGNFDKVVKPDQTERSINKGMNKFKIYREPIGHRTPLNVFEKYIMKLKKGNL